MTKILPALLMYTLSCNEHTPDDEPDGDCSISSNDPVQTDARFLGNDCAGCEDACMRGSDHCGETQICGTERPCPEVEGYLVDCPPAGDQMACTCQLVCDSSDDCPGGMRCLRDERCAWAVE